MNSLVSWFARNHVPANLLMCLIIVGGTVSVLSIKQEIFPEFATERITVSIRYLGASPAEVEEAVCVRIEEAIEGLEGIKRIRSTAAEGVGTVVIEAETDAELEKLLDEVKGRVDALDTFPEETEQPIIQELLVRNQVINIAISGDTDERTLKRIGERVRDDLGAAGLTQVELVNARPYEISIEASEESLRRHKLTFDDIVGAVRRSSLDLPGGSIKTSAGEILLRTKKQAYAGEEFEKLVLLTRADGTRVTLGDVATVVDGFADTDQRAFFDGKPSVMVQIFRVGEQSALEVAEKVHDYVAQAKRRFPEGIQLTTWQDGAVYLEGRLDLLLRNAAQGFVLVFLILALFLKIRLAVWVSIGIPISFMGTLWLLPALGVSINLLSLFAFILVLGIVVDDAIIVGESISLKQERSSNALDAAISGALRVGRPVFFAIFTSIAAFVPMLVVSGQMGKFLSVISLIVVPTLVFSLIESMLILPAHLSTTPRPSALVDFYLKPAALLQSVFARRLKWFISDVYRPFLELCLRWRYATAAVGIATLLVTLGLAGGKWIKFTFFPSVEADNVAAMLVLPQGTPVETTEKALRHLTDSLRAVEEKFEKQTGSSPIRHVLTSIGDQPYLGAQTRSSGNVGGTVSGSHLGEVHAELVPAEERTGSSEELAAAWRELAGDLPDAVELTFTSSIFSPGESINVEFSGLDVDGLRRASEALKEYLQRTPGVYDVSDSFHEGKREIKLDIRDSAEALGLSLSELARQIRQAFYGEEAQRVQRGRDDIRVMVRSPKDRRQSIGDLESMRIRTSDGGEVPFSTVATAQYGRGYSDIQRVDRHRVINVTADVSDTEANADEIVADLEKKFLPQLGREHPGLYYSFEGEQRERSESMADLRRGFAVAVFVIYALLAIPFRSYFQPIVVLLAVPFGIVGATWGHVIMGLDLTILSVFGLVALTGVVVNDSLVLVDFINRRRGDSPLVEAVREAGAARFRPILLTSLTTFAGLTPLMLFEKSLQAKFLVPMAVSLAFGVLFSTVTTLVLLPAGYLILQDIGRIFRNFGSKAIQLIEGLFGDIESTGGPALESPRRPLPPKPSDKPDSREAERV